MWSPRALTAFAVGVSLVTALPAAAAPRGLQQDLEAAVSAFPATAAVIVSDPATGYRFARNADLPFYSASLYKLGLMVEAHRQAAAGTLPLDSLITVTWNDLPSDDVRPTTFETELTVGEALETAITWSDNSTALAVRRVLGTESVNATLASLGLTGTRLDDESGDVTTAADMERLFAKLLRGEVVSAAASREMLDLLSRQHVNDRLPAWLPEGALVAHKTGNLWDVAHDVGIVWSPFGPRIAIVMTGGAERYEDVVDLAAAVGFASYADPADRFGASIAALSFPGNAVAGRPFPVTFRVTNTGTYSWADERLTLRWLRVGGAAAAEASIVLPRLAPGANGVVAVPAAAPGPGQYAVQIRASSGWLGTATTPFVIMVQVAAP